MFQNLSLEYKIWPNLCKQIKNSQQLKCVLAYCQAQGPTLGPTQGRVKVKVKVRTWSGHGQVRSNSNSNSNSKVGPELYTKIGFHHSPPTTTPTISNWVFSELCDTLWHFVTICDNLWHFVTLCDVKVLGQSHKVKLNCK